MCSVQCTIYSGPLDKSAHEAPAGPVPPSPNIYSIATTHLATLLEFNCNLNDPSLLHKLLQQLQLVKHVKPTHAIYFSPATAVITS